MGIRLLNPGALSPSFKMKKIFLLLIIFLIFAQSLFAKVGIYSNIAVLTVRDLPLGKKIVIETPLIITNNSDSDYYFEVSLLPGSKIEDKEGFEDIPELKFIRSALWKKSGKPKKVFIRAGESVRSQITIKIGNKQKYKNKNYLAYIKIEVSSKTMIGVQICPRVEVCTEK